MGKACPRPKLMPEKLLLIRKYLNVSQSGMAELLELSTPGRVSKYEHGVRDPNLIISPCMQPFRQSEHGINRRR
jgi:transcriptional regulator with XRE-family HTH domain